VTHPSDAAVARLLGYENVIDVQIDDDGNVFAAGQPTGLTAPPGRRSAELAVWATAIHPQVRRDGGIRATVERITTGPGRHKLSSTRGSRSKHMSPSRHPRRIAARKSAWRSTQP
jgi:hypothetical protein